VACWNGCKRKALLSKKNTAAALLKFGNLAQVKSTLQPDGNVVVRP